MKIILIGFMGAGKSSVGLLLAKKLGMEFIETDKLIEEWAGKSIDKIFKEDGEIEFRDLEIKTAEDLQEVDNAVISCGGGAVLNKIIIDYLKQKGVIIYLDTSYDEIKKRITSNKSRPLFQDKEKAKELYDFRKGLYERYADKVVKTDGKTAGEIAEEIFEKLKIS